MHEDLYNIKCKASCEKVTLSVLQKNIYKFALLRNEPFPDDEAAARLDILGSSSENDQEQWWDK